MPRRLGSTVPQTVSRLLQGGLLPQPPAWFEAVSSVAPVRPSLVKRVPKQDNSSTDGPSTSASTSKHADAYKWHGKRKLRGVKVKYSPAKPAPITGLEQQDKIRKAFYDDHPFEAFKGINLVEQDGVLAGQGARPGPQGKDWTELRQRSRNPSPEDCVDFIQNLNKVHDIPLAMAYSAGVAQFRALRASHEIMLHSAQQELAANGMTWPTEFSSIDRRQRAEERNIMESLGARAQAGTGGAATVATGPARPSLLDPIATKPKKWTGGLQYLTGKESGPYKGAKKLPDQIAGQGSSSGSSGFAGVQRRRATREDPLPDVVSSLFGSSRT